MKTPFAILFMSSILFMIGSCQPSSTHKKEQKKLVSKSQAILKIQQTAYDNDLKSQIKTPYKDITRLEVPPNLEPQNKWIMFEGPVLENELIAYRFYGDARHRTDIYGKKVRDMVMDTVSWDYHDIMDWGSDILKVGSSLGIGAPGIYYKDSIYTLSHYSSKSISKLDTSAKSGFSFEFKNVVIDSDTFDINQVWTLNVDSPISDLKLDVVRGKLPQGARFCTGIVKHIEEYSIASGESRKALYTYGLQSFHDQVLAMAVLVDKTEKVEYQDNPLSHVWLFEKNKQNIKYSFAAAWENDVQHVRNQQEFEQLILR